MHRTPQKLLPLLFVAAFALVASAFLLKPDESEAQRGGLRARIYLTQARIPGGLTEQGLIRFARGHSARSLREVTGRPIPEREWKAEMVTSFNRPVGDLEFQVLFYDLEDGPRRFLGPPLATFVNNRDERTFVQHIRLRRPQFKPNRHMEMVVTVHRQEIGSTRFEIVGERIHNTGEVNFTNDGTD